MAGPGARGKLPDGGAGDLGVCDVRERADEKGEKDEDGFHVAPIAGESQG